MAINLDHKAGQGEMMLGDLRFGLIGMLVCCMVLMLTGVASSSAQSPRFCQVQQPSQILADLLHRGGRGPNSNYAGVSSREDVLSFVVNKASVKPGTLIYARLVNLGRTTIGYEREFAIERYRQGNWRIDSSSPEGPWVKSLGKLRPEAVGRCYQFGIPKGQSIGRYRFSTRVRVDLATPARATRIVSEFRVE